EIVPDFKTKMVPLAHGHRGTHSKLEIGADPRSLVIIVNDVERAIPGIEFRHEDRALIVEQQAGTHPGEWGNEFAACYPDDGDDRNRHRRRGLVLGVDVLADAGVLGVLLRYREVAAVLVPQSEQKGIGREPDVGALEVRGGEAGAGVVADAA